MKNLIKWVLDLPDLAFRGIVEHAVIGWLRDGAEGKHGALVQRLVTWAKGKKTYLGFGLGAVVAVLAALHAPHSVDVALGTLAAVLAGVGIIDKAVHEPGRPEFLANSGVYRFVAQNATLISSGLAWLLTRVNGPECNALVVGKLSLSCGAQSTTLVVVAALLMYVGAIDQGFLSRQPRYVTKAIG